MMRVKRLVVVVEILILAAHHRLRGTIFSVVKIKLGRKGIESSHEMSNSLALEK